MRVLSLYNTSMQERGGGDITRHWRLKGQRSQIIASRNESGVVYTQQNTISSLHPTNEKYVFDKPQLQSNETSKPLSQAAD